MKMLIYSGEAHFKPRSNHGNGAQKPIAGFGNNTPAQVVLEFRKEDTAEMIDILHSKDLGCFQ
ncbi:MAG: hypothetical protein ACI9O6_000907 [Glaciecola sp.]|jgi:hypothetical protein